MTCKKKQEPETDGCAINTADSGHVDVEPIIRGKLTRKLFMTLEPGYYLVSNIIISPSEPIFAEIVEPEKRKMAQWGRITASGANNRICSVFENKTDYECYIAPALERIKKKP